MTRRWLCALVLAVATPLMAAQKDETITKTYPIAPGKVVLVEGGSLDVTVRSAEIPEIRVKVELSATAFRDKQAQAWIDGLRPTFEDGAETLRVVAPEPAGSTLWKGIVVSRARIELVVPPSARPDLSTSSGILRVAGEFSGGTPMRLRSSSGEIEFDGWAPDVEVRSTSGDIRVSASRAFDRFMARTASGMVTLTGGSRWARCDTSSGTVSLAGLLGPTGIATTSGKVTLAFDALESSHEVRVTTTSGRVRVTLPPGTQPGGEVTSAKGEIRSVYPGQADPEGGRLTLAGPGPKLVISSSSGKVDVN